MLLIGLSPFVFLLKFIVTLLKTGKTKRFSQENGQNNHFSGGSFSGFASS